MTLPQLDLEELLSALRGNREDGSGELALQACDAMVRGVGALEEGDPAMVRQAVRQLAGRVAAAQPGMAPVRAAAAAAVNAAEMEEEGDDGRKVKLRVIRVLAAFLRHLARAWEDAAGRAATLIPPGAQVLTVSRSSTVLAALQAAGRAGALRVICLEGRPLLEGRRLAAELAAAGVQATLAPDAAVAALVSGCDLVLVGADAIADDGVVNKIGTHAAALAAAAAGVACYVVADSSKLLPPGVVPALEDERSADELWPDAPAGVRVWNRYFEATPLELFRGVVLEDGLHAPDEVERRRREPAGP